MRIFVWRAYGEIDVSAAETSEQLKILFKEICSNLEMWGLDETIVKVHAHIERDQESVSSLIRGINELLEEINVGSHEAFELGTGFTTVRNL